MQNRKLRDYLWEGVTLKNVHERSVIIPYFLFLCLAVLFEVFLVGLFFISAYIFIVFQFQPHPLYYLCAAVLMLLLVCTVLTIKVIVTEKALIINRTNDRSSRKLLEGEW